MRLLNLVVFLFTITYSSLSMSENVKFISKQELSDNLDKFVIVDVRTALEFNVLHIVGSHHISMSNKGFEVLVKELCKEDCNIVTYCNGLDCKKSTIAAKRLMKRGLKNVYVYKEGIFNWMLTYPEKSIFLLKKPADTTQIIPKEEFDRRLVTLKEFNNKLNQKNSLYIDVRDNFQAVKDEPNQTLSNLPFRRIPIDRLRPLIEKGYAKDKHWLIADEVEKQVVWLHYYLRQYGYKNYSFLKGGIKGQIQ